MSFLYTGGIQQIIPTKKFKYGGTSNTFFAILMLTVPALSLKKKKNILTKSTLSITAV
jgi:hypothetical protein